MLLFKAKFLPLIRSGKKRQTIRLWKSPRVKPGQRAYVPGLGRVIITTLHVLNRLADLTRRDALADGFASRRELLAEIRRLYPGETAERKIFRVEFRWNAEPPPARGAIAPGARRKSTKLRPPGRLDSRREALRWFLLARMPPSLKQCQSARSP